MIDARTAPYGALLLRVSLGAMFIAHSLYLKLVVFTLPGTVKFFESLGLPGLAAHATIAPHAQALPAGGRHALPAVSADAERVALHE